jgi:hypothetical protein
MPERTGWRQMWKTRQWSPGSKIIIVGKANKCKKVHRAGSKRKSRNLGKWLSNPSTNGYLVGSNGYQGIVIKLVWELCLLFYGDEKLEEKLNNRNIFSVFDACPIFIENEPCIPCSQKGHLSYARRVYRHSLNIHSWPWPDMRGKSLYRNFWINMKSLPSPEYKTVSGTSKAGLTRFQRSHREMNVHFRSSLLSPSHLYCHWS